MIPDNLTVYVAVLGMAALTLLAASLFASYQRAQAYKRLLLQRLIMDASRDEHLLQRLSPVSLPREVRVALRQDILDRYRRVKRLHGRYRGIDQLISQSEQRLNSEGGDGGGALPVPADSQVFEQWQQAFQELLLLIRTGALSRPMSVPDRQRLSNLVLERQAECLFGHYMNLADKLKSDDRTAYARSQLQQLTEWLRGLGINTERIQSLIKQAEEAYQYLLTGKVPKPEANTA